MEKRTRWGRNLTILLISRLLVSINRLIDSEKFDDFVLDNVYSRRIESDRVERIRKEPLFDTVNTEMIKALEGWHESPYSSESASKINTLIRLVQSAGYGITLEINKRSWEDKNAAELFPDFRYRMDEDIAIVEIDPQQKADKSETYLHAHVSNPTNPLDEYSVSYSYFAMGRGGKEVTFSPEEVSSLKILEGRTFKTLKEVKDTYWPDVSDEEFLQMIDTGEIPESSKRTVERTRKANEPGSEPE